MIYFYCITLLALCGQVELFKLGLMTAPQADQAEYYPMRQQQQYGYQQQIYAARPQPMPYQPPALAYVIVRPIAPSYPYYDSSVRYLAPIQQQQQQTVPELMQQQQLQDLGTKGGERLQPPAFEQQQLVASTKGGSQIVKQEEIPAEPANQQQQQQQSDQLYDMGMGKLLKIKSSFDKFAASAKSKLTLGSHYYVSGEEYVTPAPPAQPLRQEQLHAGDIQLTKLEQQRIEDAGQVKLETQQLEDNTRETKLEETRGTKQLEETRQTKLEEASPVSQTKLEETRQEKLTEQEPLREIKGLEQQQPLQHQERYADKGREQQPLQQESLREIKGREQQPLQQERYADKGREHLQQQAQYQQKREEYQQQQQGALKADEARNQLRFNGQQPPTYLSGQTDSDGFGKRYSAL